MAYKAASMTIARQPIPIDEVASGVWDYLDEILDSLEEEGACCQGGLRRSLCSRLQMLHDHIAQESERGLSGKQVSQERLLRLSQLVERAESTELSARELAGMQSSLRCILFGSRPK